MFKKSHPFIFNANSVLIPSLITFIIIVVLAPFHFQAYDFFQRVTTGSFIALIVGFSIFFTVKLLQKCFPNLMDQDQWTVGKEFLLIWFVLAILSLIISTVLYFYSNNDYTLGYLILKTTLTTLGIGIFPVLILVLFEQFQHQKKQFKKAAALNASLQQKKDLNQVVDSLNSSLLFKSDKGKIELKLNSSDLAYIQSDGNYVEIYYFNQGEIQKKLIRNTLKNIERILPTHIFIRCHNRFIVNANLIQKVEGNARNLILHLKEIPYEIPVSRTKVKIISAFLESLI